MLLNNYFNRASNILPPQSLITESKQPVQEIFHHRIFRLCLLGVLLSLGSLGIMYNSVTIDETMHLPVGLSYYDRGQFWPYHHNPPLSRLLAALPLTVMDVKRDYRMYYYIPENREPDIELGRAFMYANASRYHHLFVISRFVILSFALLGGWFVYLWSRELFGQTGGLISLCLYCISPQILAHGGLVTPDISSMVLGLIATFQFMRYLRYPNMYDALVSGLLLGAVEASKYSYVLLPILWLGLAIIKWVTSRGMSASEGGITVRAFILHALSLSVASITVLNIFYGFEGTGKPLGDFTFRSRTLTKDEQDSIMGGSYRVNRFRDTFLAKIPVPLPEHYLLGLDDQKFDIDTADYTKYLRGERRHGSGWWYYYLYAFCVKTPVGTLLLLVIAALLFCFRCDFRTTPLSETSLLLPIVAFMVFVSTQTGMNSHLRYILPLYPFLFIFIGRVGPWIEKSRSRSLLVLLLLLSNFVSVIRVCPYHLTYFNEIAGGPQQGLKHLADSNIDWGDGLIALKRWIDENPGRQTIQVAYFGFADPEVYGIEYTLPKPNDPQPGLFAIGANYLVGIPFSSTNGSRVRVGIHGDAYTFFKHFVPIAHPGNSIYVYDISLKEANRVRKEMGLSPLQQTNDDPG